MTHDLPAEWVSRFGHRVQAVGDCLEFQGARLPSGYGKMAYQGRHTTAHRVSWALANDAPVPTGRHVVVRHSCDNPPCIAPAHLAAGSPSENTQDMLSKGRHGSVTTPGASRVNAKLTEETAAEVRRRRAEGETYASLAESFGVAKTTLRTCVAGRTWKSPAADAAVAVTA